MEATRRPVLGPDVTSRDVLLCGLAPNATRRLKTVVRSVDWRHRCQVTGLFVSILTGVLVGLSYCTSSKRASEPGIGKIATSTRGASRVLIDTYLNAGSSCYR